MIEGANMSGAIRVAAKHDAVHSVARGSIKRVSRRKNVGRTRAEIRKSPLSSPRPEICIARPPAPSSDTWRRGSADEAINGDGKEGITRAR